MSKLDDLIKELCPNGVEWVNLCETVNILDNLRKPVSKKNRISGEYPYYGANGIQDYVEDYIFDGIFILMGEDGSVINVDQTPVLTWATGKIWVNNHAHIMSELSEKALLRYIYFCLSKTNVSDIVRGTPPKINQQNLRAIKIPLPPLPVQKEIVRILDSFTELTARKKQYEYYERKLLFDSDHPKFPLDNFCSVNQGLQIPISNRKTEDGENRYFYITVQFLKGSEEKYFIESPSQNVICDYDDILVTRTGSTGKIITGVKGCFHNNFFKVNCFNTINKRYMFYILNSKVMFDKLLRTASGGTVPDLPHNKFYKIEIPVPYPNDIEKSLAEQQRVVDILDRFDTLCNDISNGLPAEIKARQQQYAYYRDKLLSFERLEE